MTSPTFLTWDGGDGQSPRRPSKQDMGGDGKKNNQKRPPKHAEQPRAEDWNQIVKQIEALARVVPCCSIEIRFDAGAPYVSRATAASANVLTSTFTVTDNGNGDTTITWPADTFPPAQLSPSGLTLLSSTTQETGAVLEEVTNGIRVRTRQNGAAADVPFTVDIR